MSLTQFYYIYIYFKAALVICNFNVSEALGLARVLLNASTQYSSIIVALSVGHPDNIGPKMLIEPMLGLRTTLQFIIAAKTAADKKKRICTAAVYLATSAATVLTMDPATNAAFGATIAAKISCMDAILLKGGSFLLPPVTNFALIDNQLVPTLLSPAQLKVQENWNFISQNMFREHAARRCAQAAVHKIGKFSPTSIALLNTAGLIVWAGIAVGLFSLAVVTTVFALEAFQRSERRRYGYDGIVIDVTASIDTDDTD